MKLTTVNLIFLLSLSTSSFTLSQEVKHKIIIPSSIYSLQPNFSDLNYKTLINKRLNFKRDHFCYVNKEALEDGSFAIPFSPLGKKPSSLVFNTYNDIYQTKNLQSSFFKVSKLYNMAPLERK